MESGLSSPSLRKEERSGRLPAVPDVNIARRSQNKSGEEETGRKKKKRSGKLKIKIKKKENSGRKKEYGKMKKCRILQQKKLSFPPFPAFTLFFF